MKIILFTDVHANLPALQAMLSVTRADGYDLLVHLGDAIAIGPYPSETLELLLSTARSSLLKAITINGLQKDFPIPSLSG